MVDSLDETVDPEELKLYERIYHEKLHKKAVTPKVQFEYSWCLVRSKYAADVQKGVLLLEDLYKTDTTRQRDYLYYLAIGSARLKEYTKAMHYSRLFLTVEPENRQVQTLQQTIKTRKERDGLKGMMKAGGVVLAITAIVGAGIAIANRLKP
ncbi:mitochondrial fission 1 protein-like [Aethina tumida]|uniref:mitochondrial fission 1 protein-like n=1 Tax=Aethina tumida TaxID=116153 RepID=UPI002149511F|nr:mitochondrial fission 1 protein-like [Aethina tumida]